MQLQIVLGSSTRVILAPITSGDEMLLVSLVKVLTEGGTISTWDKDGEPLWQQVSGGIPSDVIDGMPQQLREYIDCLKGE